MVNEPEHGSFIWNELNTHDPEKAKTFYAETLGWSYETMPMEDGTDYAIIVHGGRRVGGIFALTGPDFEGMPDHWMAYVGVDDVDARLARVEAAGGSIIRPAFDVAGVGRIGVMRDSTGAYLAWMTPRM
ncbi:VOC family protein [Ancylobacter radicis]|uniref:VOC family protein n=1 Tax=Ancylobacter radicis TaxID=2836179 RepID=A0ABS5R6Y5_9HYPH|nr:VOC family protein [Ancylobacter radicis]MBS9477262.1 VOC family protein [Ancylobacter radicis]